MRLHRPIRGRFPVRAEMQANCFSRPLVSGTVLSPRGRFLFSFAIRRSNQTPSAVKTSYRHLRFEPPSVTDQASAMAARRPAEASFLASLGASLSGRPGGDA